MQLSFFNSKHIAKYKLSKYTLLASALFAGFTVSAQQIPGNDIYIADINLHNKKVALANITNISNRAGYDNQPNFLPDGSGVMYTAMLKNESGEVQSDSLKYTFATKQTTNLTNTPKLSEYSPTKIAGKNAFSAIVVEEDGTQRLWQYELNSAGKKSTVILPDVKPVGYHAWGKKGDLTMFILGEPMTLQYAESVTAKPKLIDSNIGRSIRYSKKYDEFSYTQYINDEKAPTQLVLKRFSTSLNSTSLKPTALINLPQGSEYFTWLNDDTALSAVGSEIFSWHRGDDNWQLMADLKAHCATNITRLAVDKKSSKLAFVCDE